MADAPPRGLGERLRDTRARLEGDVFAARTGFDPRELDELHQYFLVRPRRVQAWREVDETRGATSCATAAGSADARRGCPARPEAVSR